MHFKRRTTTLRFEALETRRLLDGDINFSVSGTTLTLTGDNSSNAVAVTTTSDGVIEVLGLTPLAHGADTPSPTTIGGHSSKFFQGITSLVLNFNGTGSGNRGNDAIVLTGLSLDGSASISLGDGDDLLALGQFDNSAPLVDAAANSLIGPLTAKAGIWVSLQGGANTLLAKNVTVQGPTGPNFTINGGDGNDTFTLTSVTVAHGTIINDNGAATITIDHFTTNALTLALGIGNDHLTISNSAVKQGATINTNFGNDVVALDHTTVGSLVVSLGRGNDQLTLTSVTGWFTPASGNPFEIPAPLSIDAGDGNDVVSLNTVDASPLNVGMGIGDDALALNNTRAGDAMIGGGDGADTITANTFAANSLGVWGGFGNDTINLQGVGVAHGALIDAGGGADSVTLATFNANALTVRLGAGNDHAWLEGVTVAGATTIDGGAGNDSVVMENFSTNTLTLTLGDGSDHLSVMHVVSHKKSVLGGGNGHDLFSTGGSNSFNQMTRRNFDAFNNSMPS